MWIIMLILWVDLRIPDNVHSAWPVAGFPIGCGWHLILNKNSAEKSNLQGKFLRIYALHLFFQIFVFTSGLSQVTRDLCVCSISFMVGACQDVYAPLSLGKMPWAFSGEHCSNTPIKLLHAPCVCAVRMWFTAWHATLNVPWETFLSDLNISNNCFFLSDFFVFLCFFFLKHYELLKCLVLPSGMVARNLGDKLDLPRAVLRVSGVACFAFTLF